MSRRKSEFEHRTSIFEGAFRAWSYLGGLDANDVLDTTANDLDPLSHPIEHDKRWLKNSSLDNSHGNMSSLEDETPEKSSLETLNLKDSIATCCEAPKLSGSSRKEYYYEPLPRTGLTHPFVKAIITSWLGDDATKDAIEVGLTTLRTWWQHRKKGASASAIKAIDTDNVRVIVDNYTRHFFKLAHCLVVNEDEPPPRSLIMEWNQAKRLRERVTKKKQKEGIKSLAMFDSTTRKVEAAPQYSNLSISQSSSNPTIKINNLEPTPPINNANITPLDKLKNAQKRLLSQLHSDPLDNMNKGKELQSKRMKADDDLRSETKATQSAEIIALQSEGDTTPVVFVSDGGDVLIGMKVEGMSYPHCVNIVETVLRGCERKEGRVAPIQGIIDAVADLQLASVLIKIEKSSQAKRIAQEAKRNLSMVGYHAHVREMDIINLDGKPMDFSMLNAAFDVIADTESTHFFDWSLPCICMSDITVRGKCERHKQMKKDVFEAFERREKQVSDFFAGCAKKHGLPCNCGVSCRCKGCECKAKGNSNKLEPLKQSVQETKQSPEFINPAEPRIARNRGNVPSYTFRIHQQQTVPQDTVEDQKMPSLAIPTSKQSPRAHGCSNLNQLSIPQADTPIIEIPDSFIGHENRKSNRNFSLISSISGLSTIEWDNIPGFDVDEDHSAHIDPYVEDDLYRRFSIHSFPEAVRGLRGILRRTSVIYPEKINPTSETGNLDNHAIPIEALHVPNNDETYRRNAARTLSLISTMSSLSAMEWEKIHELDLNDDNTARGGPHVRRVPGRSV